MGAAELHLKGSFERRFEIDHLFIWLVRVGFTFIFASCGFFIWLSQLATDGGSQLILLLPMIGVTAFFALSLYDYEKFVKRSIVHGVIAITDKGLWLAKYGTTMIWDDVAGIYEGVLPKPFYRRWPTWVQWLLNVLGFALALVAGSGDFSPLSKKGDEESGYILIARLGSAPYPLLRRWARRNYTAAEIIAHGLSNLAPDGGIDLEACLEKQMTLIVINPFGIENPNHALLVALINHHAKAGRTPPTK